MAHFILGRTFYFKNSPLEKYFPTWDAEYLFPRKPTPIPTEIEVVNRGISQTACSASCRVSLWTRALFMPFTEAGRKCHINSSYGT